MRKLRVGSRGSELALTQTRGIVAELQPHVPTLQVEIEIIRTQGDIVTDVPLSKVGDRGLFIKEIETALIENRIDNDDYPGLPICLAEDVSLKRDIAKDEKIFMPDVSYDPDRFDFKLHSMAVEQSNRKTQ